MNKKIFVFASSIITVICLTICSCASGKSIVTGNIREPVEESQVKLYTEPPSDYEVIGIVSASSEDGITEQKSLDYAIARVKKEAGKLGANGVLLENVGQQAGSYYLIGNVLASGTLQTVSGKAIYVRKE